MESLLATSRKSGKFLAQETILQMFRQLVDGMEAINARLIHRDIKPDNIVVSGNDLKITDFGLSKLVQEATRTSTFKGFGCLQSLAPEAWMSEKNTTQMDIYSMGLVFYEIATLRYPYSVAGSDPHLWKEAHLYQSVSRPEKHNPNIGQIVSQVIMGMLEKKPSGRPKD